mgnify:CR=1 FL=1
MPRKFSVVALSFIILFLSAPGKASAESIDPVIKRMVAKYKKINAKVKDMSFEQEMEMTDPGGKSITQKIKFYKKGKKYRMDMVMKMPSNPNLPPGMGEIKTIIIFDGKNKWAISSMTGKQNMGPPAKGDDSNWWDSMRMEDMGDVKAKLIGSGKVAGRDCYIVESNDDGDVSKLWLTKDSLTQMKVEAATKQGAVQMLYSDHKKVGDLFEWPYTTTIMQNGKKMSTIKVKWMKINTGLSSALFDANAVKAPAGMNMQEMMEKMMNKRRR